jgi:hypothetical protein
VLILEKPWTSQPQGSVGINWSNPITKGLVFCAVPLGRTFIDLVTNTIGEASGTTNEVRTQNGGFSRRSDGYAVASSNGSLDQVLWPESTTKRGATAVQEGTLLSLGGVTLGGANYYIAPMGGCIDTATGHGINLYLDHSGFVGFGAILRSNSDATPIGASAVEILGADPALKTHFYGFSFTSNGASGTWLGARQGFDWTGGTVFGTGATGRRAMMFTGYANASYPTKRGFVLLQLIFDRKLTVAEYQSLYDNPWQLFAPQEIKIPLSGGAVSGAPVSFGDLKAVSITSSSVQATYDYAF